MLFTTSIFSIAVASTFTFNCEVGLSYPGKAIAPSVPWTGPLTISPATKYANAKGTKWWLIYKSQNSVLVSYGNEKPNSFPMKNGKLQKEIFSSVLFKDGYGQQAEEVFSCTSA